MDRAAGLRRAGLSWRKLASVMGVSVHLPHARRGDLGS